jgi:hypothetical protein
VRTTRRRYADGEPDPEGVGALKPEQQKSIERMEKFLDTLTATLGRLRDDDGEDGDGQDRAAQKRAAQRIARVVLREEKAKT